MRRPLKPPTPDYWQLDLLMAGMLGLLFLLMWLGIPAGATTLVIGAWAALMLGGMGLWVWANRLALSTDARDPLEDRPAGDWPGREIPLTPVQRHFMAIQPGLAHEHHEPLGLGDDGGYG